MNPVAHTQGPWAIYYDNAFDPGALYVAAVNREIDEAICKVAPADNITELDHAHARMIVAAPVLLVAVKAARAFLYDEGYLDEVMGLDKVIAKAEGRAE